MASIVTSLSCHTADGHIKQPRGPLLGLSKAHLTRNNRPCQGRISAGRSDAACQDRRQYLIGLAGLIGIYGCQPVQALGFKKELKKRKLTESDYTASTEDGLKIYELLEGNGPEVTNGSSVVVHFDCKFRGIDVVSSRSARLLGGNRSIAEPFAFTAGDSLGIGSRVASDRGGGGLFSGEGGPKPPPALSSAVIGMKLGGKRSVLVPPERGYGEKGVLEIPPNATIQMEIELLSVK